jgi:hypothetical protein
MSFLKFNGPAKAFYQTLEQSLRRGTCVNATAVQSLKNIEQVKEEPRQRGGPNDRDDDAKPEHDGKDRARAAERRVVHVTIMSIVLRRQLRHGEANLREWFVKADNPLSFRQSKASPIQN